MSTTTLGVLQLGPQMVAATYQMKKGNQQRMKAPMMMPNVFAALCSRFILEMVRLVGVELPDSGSSPLELRCGPDWICVCVRANGNVRINTNTSKNDDDHDDDDGKPKERANFP